MFRCVELCLVAGCGGRDNNTGRAGPFYQNEPPKPFFTFCFSPCQMRIFSSFIFFFLPGETPLTCWTSYAVLAFVLSPQY